MSTNPSHQRHHFLDKFQGKKNIISKEGLLHLLENQLQTYDQRNHSDKQKPGGPLDKLKPIESRQYSKDTPPRSQPLLQKKSTGHLIDKKAEIRARPRYGQSQELLELKSQQLLNKHKLPSINKSSSLSISKKLERDVMNAQITGTTGVSGSLKHHKSLKKKPENGENAILNNLAKKVPLDSYALKHLEFLDKFELQLLNSDAISKRTVKSQIH